MKRTLSFFLLVTVYCLLPYSFVRAHEKSADSLRTTEIEEVVVVSTPKENQRLRQQPLSFTAFSQNDMRQQGLAAITDFSAQVPNLYIPSYGSHLTTSVYVRGIGSRTGTPAVALYVDGVPQVSAASYDFNFSNVDRVDVLRGPQSTLYGRNSMGGVIRVFTKNPMQYQGTDITLDAGHVVGSAPSGRSDGGGAGRYRLALTHYHRISDQFAFSGHLFGLLDDGYFRNEARSNHRMDDEQNLGARMRFIYLPSSSLHFDLTLSHEWLRQGGYPYEYRGIVGNPTTPEPDTPVGHIAYYNRSGYRRNLTHVGLTTEKLWQQVQLTSVTGFQHLHDRMDLDQDFTDRNLYTLMQRQNANTLSEEVVLKNRTDLGKSVDAKWFSNQYDWLFGLTAIRQWNRTEGPVTFHADGLDWLNGLVNRMANSHMPTVSSPDYSMNFAFDNQIIGSDLGFPGIYKTPTTNLALFHQSSFTGLLGVSGLQLTAGLRLDYERLDLRYHAWYGFDQRYALGGRLTYPDGSVREGMVLVPETHFRVDDGLEGRLHQDYLQLLPRVTLQYSFSTGQQTSNVYATWSRGYRSGGYNAQMFSDLLQTRMQTRILQNVTAATLPVVRQQPSMPDVAKATVEQILTSMSAQRPTDVQAATWYEPESSWNYELGSHLNLWDGRLQADVAAFWMQTRNQQVSRMSAGGLGRVTVNTGRSRSLGAELSLRAQLTDGLSCTLCYGLTHARFLQPTDDADSTAPLADADGTTFVPFVPRHTLAAGITQRWPMPVGCWLDAVSLHADGHAAGRIYWNEQNTASQGFAGQLNLRVGLHRGGTEVALSARNLLSSRHQAFYFETMQRAFAQYTRPLELALQLRLRL